MDLFVWNRNTKTRHVSFWILQSGVKFVPMVHFRSFEKTHYSPSKFERDLINGPLFSKLLARAIRYSGFFWGSWTVRPVGDFLDIQYGLGWRVTEVHRFYISLLNGPWDFLQMLTPKKHRRGRWGWGVGYICWGLNSKLPILGTGIPPVMTGILIINGYINHYC